MELFRLLGTIAIDNAKALAGLDETQKKAKTTSEKMATAFTNIGQKSIDLGKKLGLLSAGAGVAFGKMIKDAADYKAMNAQFAQTFSGFEKEATAAMRNVANESGIMETRLKGVGTQIFAFAKTTGMDSPEALGMMERALKVTADSAAYYDRSLEETSESLKSFLKGNFENDAALGLSCTETTRNAAANKLYGKSFMELSESQKQLTLLQMVEDANKLSGAMGQASRESDGWENVMGNLKESIKRFSAELGEQVLPTVTTFIQTATNFISKLSGMGDGTKKLIVGLVALTAAASPVLIVFGNLMKTTGIMITGFTKSVSAINAARVACRNYQLATDGASFAAAVMNGELTAGQALVGNLGAKINALTNLSLKNAVASKMNALAQTKVGSAAKSAAVRVLAFATAHKIALLSTVGLIAPLVLLGVYMTKTGKTGEEMAADITAFSNKLAVGILKFANNLPAMIDAVLPAVTSTIQGIVSTLPTLIPALVQAGIQLFMALVDSLNQVIPPLVAALPQIVQAVVDALPVLIPALIQAGVTLFMALVQAIPQIVGALISALPQIIQALKTGLADGCSKVWDMIKKAAEKKWKQIKNKITEPIDNAKQKVKEKIQDIKSFFSFDNLLQTVKDKFEKLKDNLFKPIEKAKNKIKSILTKIKGFFPIKIGKIFKNLKLPKISVSMKKNSLGIPTPKFSVNWNAKGAVFGQPTIFATQQGLQGVGEAGKEAVAPIDTLQQYVATAVASQNSELVTVLNEILGAIKTMDAGVYSKIETALDSRKIQWNDRELGRFVKNYAG